MADGVVGFFVRAIEIYYGETMSVICSMSRTKMRSSEDVREKDKVDLKVGGWMDIHLFL
jgi:hypothetical protein